MRKKRIRKIVKHVHGKLLDAAGRVVLGKDDPDYEKELRKLLDKEKGDENGK